MSEVFFGKEVGKKKAGFVSRFLRPRPGVISISKSHVARELEVFDACDGKREEMAMGPSHATWSKSFRNARKERSIKGSTGVDEREENKISIKSLTSTASA